MPLSLVAMHLATSKLQHSRLHGQVKTSISPSWTTSSTCHRMSDGKYKQNPTTSIWNDFCLFWHLQTESCYSYSKVESHTEWVGAWFHICWGPSTLRPQVPSWLLMDPKKRIRTIQKKGKKGPQKDRSIRRKKRRKKGSKERNKWRTSTALHWLLRRCDSVRCSMYLFRWYVIKIYCIHVDSSSPKTVSTASIV